jgi:ABC-type Fe3+-hydroxamate transport system substrate-binding protein
MTATSTQRIVSLVPSLTETLCYFGKQQSIVGCTSFCTEPKSLRKSVPSVGGTKDANIEKIIQLKPSHVVVNREENTESLIAKLRELTSLHHFELIETFLEFPEDNFSLIEELDQTFEFGEQAQLWCRAQKSNLSELRRKMQSKENFSFVYFIWMNPWMTAGNHTYISRCLELIGGENTFKTGTQLNERYPVVTPSDQRISDAQWLLFSSEPFPFKNRHIEKFLAESGENKSFLKVDGQALSWYGSRFEFTIKELETLRAQVEEN